MATVRKSPLDALIDPMRDHVVYFRNGERVETRGPDAFAPLVDVLRDRSGLVGTKLGCGSGDCGACSVLLGRPDPETGERIRYRPAASCLLAPIQVDGLHVVTVEGVGTRTQPSPIQTAMVEHHGSQCGFCTPGMVVALAAAFENGLADEAALRAALVGNLCRCTGYLPILRAAQAVDPAVLPRMDDRYPPEAMVGELRALGREPLRVESGDGRVFVRPDRLSDAVRFRTDRPDAVLLAGGTEVNLRRNRRGVEPAALLSLAAVADLNRIEREGDAVRVGANVTWAVLDEYCRQSLPEFAEVVRQFASPQIRAVATLAGNVAHASPVADATAVLLVLGSTVEVVGPGGPRSVPIAEFHRGDRQTALGSDEIIIAVRIGVPEPGEIIRYLKVTKRKDQDVSTFRAAVRMRMDGDRIDEAVVAFSGVGPTATRMTATSGFLRGRPFTEETFHAAGRVARGEVDPGSDHRGSRDYRLRLAGSILLRFYHETSRDGGRTDGR